MEAVQVIKGGGYDEVHNLDEIKAFLGGDDFGYIINGGGGKRKRTNWAKLESILVMNNGEPLLIKHGDFLVRTDKGDYVSLTEEEYRELV
jgi:hypothetical protein